MGAFASVRPCSYLIAGNSGDVSDHFGEFSINIAKFDAHQSYPLYILVPATT